MVHQTLWATAALLPLLTANALIFEPSSRPQKRQSQHHRLAQKAKRAAPVLPATWAYDNCYTDGGARTFNAAQTASDTMTVDTCVAYCDAHNYIYAGVEYSKECYCDNTVKNGGVVAASGCDMMCAGDATQVCGGGNRLSVYKSSKTPPAGPTPLATYGNWGYQGCYTEGTNGQRALTTPMGFNTPLTPAMCLDACHNANFAFAGLEYSQECYCGNAIANGGALAADASTCSMTCAGDAAHLCGGGNRLTVYQYNAPAVTATTATTTATTSATATGATTSATGPAVLPAYNGYNSMGCYVDGINGQRTLPNGADVPGGAAAMTVEKCIDACQTKGYTVAGVEYSQECFCSNTAPTVVATDGRCDMTCKGNPLEYCGGGNGLNVYQYGGTPASTTSATATATTSADPNEPTTPHVLQTYGNWVSQGCWTDPGNPRSLTFGGNVAGAMTPQKCMDACYTAGYSLAGVEYSGECYCGNTVGGAAANDGCTMLCNGNQSLYCGGPNRLNLYSYNGVVPPPAGNGGDNGGGGNNPNAVGPVTAGLPANWHYANCYIDNAFGRILNYGVAASQTNSAANCIAQCQAAGYTLAGMEFGVECYCGNALYNGAAVATADSQCDTPCAGDTAHACGAGNRISLYSSVANFDIHPVPSVLKTGLVGDYVYGGCYAEPPLGPNYKPTFPNKITDLTGNAPLKCLQMCHDYGYDAAALEYGVECWCGSFTDIADRGATVATETQCDIPCPGDPDHLCGGTGKFNLYKWPSDQGNPLYQWADPANKGHYEYLIGGLIIPLIATLGVNNKVTLMEKAGTGAPNTTGAYELDYTLSNDYTKAFREMHVASDVFCAANLVLPDKAGRVLSVGGWSFESTYGIRLYTPDGSLGVNGTNDWEEHYDQIHLQQGRWYPGAMVMANGSVLIIGGEEGSNGLPIPTIEVLPKPAGGPTYLEMDWLLRTDPNNLYPFSFVMPAGGILVVYYNEARILDEVTFATVKTLPIIPGRVGGGGGRTYPLEGTAMLLPQHAPYTDPIEVLVCGGSDFGQVLDNCVSTQPESANPTWVVERMPTRRVMTIMAALPDGTFIIMGGALSGVAGFGLGEFPNLTSLLYDPSKPHGQRFSKLASTTVARLYHSEATLLHDGRVLVTGSDPEDGVNPQEYRYEVYVPPYLTKGIPQPTYTIVNKDWSYGGTYQIIVTSSTQPASQGKITLLGATSSTHGNTFGQRTFFPQASCAGPVCQITAPPNAHVCPPGWYMLFFLDDGVPSFSQWVRIGGDPGQIGNWPAGLPGFQPPGV